MEPITTTLDVPCPVCATSPVTCMLPTRSGAYCRCDSCGNMWLEKEVAAPRRAARYPGRRYSDGTERMSEVRSLKQRVARLEWELAALRQSATFFADLAERLNARLRESRERQREG